MLPKRFPDRTEVAAVRAAAERAENGETLDDELRVAGRVMARREMGKLTFLDLVDRSGRLQLIVEQELELSLGDIVGATGRPGRSRRGEPSLVTSQVELLAKIRKPLPDTFHGVTDRRDALPAALPRPADERRLARAGRHAHEDRRRGARLPRRRGLPRGRDADPAAALRRRLRGAVRDALERARRRPLPADRGRALPQAPDRRRAGEGLRAEQGLPQRVDLLQALARVHAGRVVRGLRRLPRHDGASRGARRRGRRRGRARARSPSAGTSSTSRRRGSG